MKDDFTQLENSLIDDQVQKNVKLEKAKQDGKAKTVDELKPMTTKELTKQLALAMHHLEQLEYTLNVVMQQQTNIDAAAYLACASLDRKGNLMGIKTLNRNLQDRLANKIQNAKKVIQDANDKRNAKLVEETNKRTEEKLKELRKQAKDEGTKANKQSK